MVESRVIYIKHFPTYIQQSVTKLKALIPTNWTLLFKLPLSSILNVPSYEARLNSKKETNEQKINCLGKGSHKGKKAALLLIFAEGEGGGQTQIQSF